MHLHNFVSMDLSSKEDNTPTLCQDIFSYLATESMHVYHDIFQIVTNTTAVEIRHWKYPPEFAAPLWHVPAVPTGCAVKMLDGLTLVRTAASQPNFSGNLQTSQSHSSETLWAYGQSEFLLICAERHNFTRWSHSFNGARPAEPERDVAVYSRSLQIEMRSILDSGDPKQYSSSFWLCHCALGSRLKKKSWHSPPRN